MDATREIEYKMEERLSKNTCCSNINTKKEIPSFLEVKDEKSSHNRRKVMSKLIKHVLENNKDVKIESALGDGSSMIVMRNSNTHDKIKRSNLQSRLERIWSSH
jgi:phosphomannomutase